jgi:hypothetical protein
MWGMDKTLTAFIWVWVSMILLANIFGIWGLFASADSTDDAMQQFREIYSPTNIANWLLEIVALSPAIAAYIWRERRRKNALRHQASL